GGRAMLLRHDGRPRQPERAPTPRRPGTTPARVHAPPTVRAPNGHPVADRMCMKPLPTELSGRVRSGEAAAGRASALRRPAEGTGAGTLAQSPAAASTCTAGGTADTVQLPDVEDGKFNVAMVLIGPHDDAGWSQAHYEGLLYVCENVPDTHVAYVELVPEGADS